MNKEDIILSALTKDFDYAKKVIPFLKADYFPSKQEQITYLLIEEFFLKYSKLPSRDVLTLKLDELKNIPEAEFDLTKEVLTKSFKDEYEYERDWLIDETEAYCKNRAMHNAIISAVQIINGDDKKRGQGEIPKLVSDALAISFNKNLGHDYFKDVAKRYEYYHSTANKIPFRIKILNDVTNGGVGRKTLNFFVAPPKAGKSTGLCSLAADYLRDGLNVVYITLELAEEKIAERIDANMLSVYLSNVSKIEETVFLNRIKSLEEKTHGSLRIKEYATKSASALDFDVYLDDLLTKENFKVDVIIVDYLGITASATYRNSSNVNSYTYQKAVSEELRALAFKWNAAVWSALQTNREGYDSSDFTMSSIADSTGPLQTCDFAIGIIRTPELDESHQCMFKQLATRYGDVSYKTKFVVGFETAFMRVVDCDDDSQSKVVQDVDSTPKKKVAQQKGKKTVSTDDWQM